MGDGILHVSKRNVYFITCELSTLRALAQFTGFEPTCSRYNLLGQRQKGDIRQHWAAFVASYTLTLHDFTCFE